VGVACAKMLRIDAFVIRRSRFIQIFSSFKQVFYVTIKRYNINYAIFCNGEGSGQVIQNRYVDQIATKIHTPDRLHSSFNVVGGGTREQQ